jgi:adenylosuccinate lyase
MEEKEVNQASAKRLTKAELEKMLLDNFVNLQKVLTNLSVKFDVLSSNISKLLQLFELSAKSLAQKKAGGGIEKDEDLMNKLDSLLEQNKTIAKGLTLIEGRLRESAYNSNLSESSKFNRSSYTGYGSQ